MRNILLIYDKYGPVNNKNFNRVMQQMCQYGCFKSVKFLAIAPVVFNRLEQNKCAMIRKAAVHLSTFLKSLTSCSSVILSVIGSCVTNDFSPWHTVMWPHGGPSTTNN